MQTKLVEFVQHREEHEELEKILRSCVHCGFCNATCPTYQVTGNELDGPRGRIYLLKQLLEGAEVGEITQNHLDRCLSCGSCHTSCPSGVEYTRLLDLGRIILEQKVSRALTDRFKRRAMTYIFPHRQRFKRLMQLIRFFKPVLPKKYKTVFFSHIGNAVWPKNSHQEKVILLTGCVQPELRPSIDIAAALVLDKLKISLLQVASAECCGALDYHLSEHEAAMALARNNIDACWPYIEQGVDTIVMTASGCGAMLKEYANILQYDPVYAKKAKKFSACVKDLGEVLQNRDLSAFQVDSVSIALHTPCTLKHGQKLAGLVDSILLGLGYELSEVDNAYGCCGSAGVYSILQPEMADRLRENMIKDLHVENVDYLVTANIGCLTHMQQTSPVKVVHWIELLWRSKTDMCV